MLMPSKKFETTIKQDDATTGCFIELPFDPEPVLGKVRAPVKVTVNGFTFRSTVFFMGGQFMVPFNKANRDGAGVAAGDKIKVLIELDTEKRTVAIPNDLAAALAKNKTAAAVWEKMSYTHKREYVESIENAKRPETRRRRIEKTLDALEKKL
jgi:hypothetical protein